jgi:F-type H+-transporting ATPase subunit delta
MNLTKKAVTTYSKSLFQNVIQLKSTETTDSFEITKMITGPTETRLPTVFVIAEELAYLRSLFKTSKKLRAFFGNPTYSEQQKGEILFQFFPGFTLTTKSFLKVLIERSHLSLLPEIADEYNRLLCKFQKVTTIHILTASILEESYGPFLLETFKKVTASEEILLSVAYNPKLLGGLIIEYNSTSIDASILKEFSLFFNEI